MKRWLIFLVIVAFMAVIFLVDEIAMIARLLGNQRIQELALSVTENAPQEAKPVVQPQNHVRKVINKEDSTAHRKIGTVTTNSSEFFASRLPQQPSHPPPSDKRILVVYSGPTNLTDADFPIESYQRGHKMIELYRLNFEFFLQHGVQCQSQDTILVLTDLVAAKYQAQVDDLHRTCQTYGHQVILAIRNNTCLDLESVRVALYGGYIDVSSYDYFVYINCGVTGPAPSWATIPWTHVFTSKLNDKVKMTGISMNCKHHRPHIQSMMYAMDRDALKIVMDGGAIFDCTKTIEGYATMAKDVRHGKIVQGYERKMGELLLDAGYGISSILRPITIFRHNVTTCRDKRTNETLNDLWLTYRMNDYFGTVPSLEEVIFIKTSRILTPETAALINFTLKVDWNW